MYKIEFTLKQHTPLIHFQNDEGATLRATELKPKLDQFLIELFLNVRGEKFEYAHEARTKFLSIVKSEHKYDWIKGGIKADENKIALDYKVNITAKDAISTKIEAEQKVPMFFGNMGDDYNQNPKYFSFAESIKVQFTTKCDHIYNLLKENFTAFILITNFGTRQDKGYGSFSTEFTESDLLKINYSRLIFNAKYESDHMLELFKVINYYYQRLKSGINYSRLPKGESYKDSFLKKYLANQHDYKWEKAWMKRSFFPHVKTNIPFVEKENGKMLFARSLMGLYPTVTFRPGNRANPNNAVWPERELNIDVTDPLEVISRIKSPITFKPLVTRKVGGKADITVLIIVKENYFEPLRNKRFTFSSGNLEFDLNAPSEPINIEDLVSKYNEELSNKFTAYDFSGNSWSVSIK